MLVLVPGLPNMLVLVLSSHLCSCHVLAIPNLLVLDLWFGAWCTAWDRRGAHRRGIGNFSNLGFVHDHPTLGVERLACRRGWVQAGAGQMGIGHGGRA